MGSVKGSLEQSMMEKSKIPVYSHGLIQPVKDCPTDTIVPCPKKICPSKPVLPLFSKDPNINFAGKDPVNGMFKATSQRPALASKRTVSGRGIIARYRIEAEFRDKNQLLKSENTSLHRDLRRAQETIKDLTDRQEILEGEVKELNKRLERHIVILESSNIDPDTGNRIIKSVEERNKCQTEAKLLRENLIKELNSFSEMAAETMMELQEVKSKWQAAEEAGHAFMEEYRAFQKDLEQYQLVLMEAERLSDHNG